MDETMIEINAVIDQLASKLIQKDEFDYDIKDALKELVALNSPGTTFSKVSTIADSGVKTGELKFEVKDLQESNYELLANVCDLLGMNNIYLDDEEE